MILKYKDFSYNQDYNKIITIMESIVDDYELNEDILTQGFKTLKNVVDTGSNILQKAQTVMKSPYELLHMLGKKEVMSKGDFETFLKNYVEIYKGFSSSFKSQYKEQIAAIDKILKQYIDKTAADVELITDEEAEARDKDTEEQIKDILQRMKSTTSAAEKRKLRQKLADLKK